MATIPAIHHQRFLELHRQGFRFLLTPAFSFSWRMVEHRPALHRPNGSTHLRLCENRGGGNRSLLPWQDLDKNDDAGSDQEFSQAIQWNLTSGSPRRYLHGSHLRRRGSTRFLQCSLRLPLLHLFFHSRIHLTLRVDRELCKTMS